MRALFALVSVRSSVVVAVLLIAGAGVIVWLDLLADAKEHRDRQVEVVSAVVAVTTEQDVLRTTVTRTSPAGELAVHLPGGGRVGPTRASADDVAAAARSRQSRTVTVSDGEVLLQPVTDVNGRTAIVETFAPDMGIAAEAVVVIGVLILVALVGTATALFTVDRMTAPVVGQLTRLSEAANTPAVQPGEPTLSWRPSRRTPRELNLIAAMITRVGVLAQQLVAREHKMIADVSHRLRTPLAALRLDVDAIGQGPVAERIRSAVVALEHDVENIIRTAGQAPEPINVRPEAFSCDLASVVRRRMQFWQVLAENQGRRCEVDCPDEPAMVSLAENHVADIVDNLVDNVFRHTEPGTALSVSVGRHAGWISLVVDDAGPGFADPETALQRGVSGGDSTGLGLDIARTRVEETGGTIHLERSRLRGARVRLRFAEARLERDDRVPRTRRIWRDGHNGD